MKMPRRRRLWLGFSTSLAILPIIFGLMFWSMGSTERVMEKGDSVLSQARSATTLYLAISSQSGGTRRAMAQGTADISDRKSTRLNSSHVKISYAVFCLKKKI